MKAGRGCWSATIARIRNACVRSLNARANGLPPSRRRARARASEALLNLRRDRLVGREGQEAQGHCDRRGARRRGTAANPPWPHLVAAGSAEMVAEAGRERADPIRL